MKNFETFKGLDFDTGTDINILILSAEQPKIEEL